RRVLFSTHWWVSHGRAAPGQPSRHWRRPGPLFRRGRTKPENAVQEPSSEFGCGETADGFPYPERDVHRGRPGTRPLPHYWGKLRGAPSKFGPTSHFSTHWWADGAGAAAETATLPEPWRARPHLQLHQRRKHCCEGHSGCIF